MIIKSTYILLESVMFYARHGVSPQETQVGNNFTINLRIKADFTAATETDDVSDTISYADVYKLLAEEMATPSKLLEHVCRRIVVRLFDSFPQIEEVMIRLSKQNPPMGADIDSAGVEMHCQR